METVPVVRWFSHVGELHIYSTDALSALAFALLEGGADVAKVPESSAKQRLAT